MPAFAGRYSIWRMSGRVNNGGQLQALGVIVSTFVYWGILFGWWKIPRCTYEDDAGKQEDWDAGDMYCDVDLRC